LRVKLRIILKSMVPFGRTEGRAMIVCHCHAVTDREIRAAARRGAATCEEIRQGCRAGGDCGGCVARVQMILQGEHKTAAEPTSQAVAV
jgi:bacterioferritin-associated ferredoxin